MDKVWRESLNMTQRYEIKAALGLQPATPTSFLHAPEPYGLGIDTIEHKYNANNLSACITDLNHKKKLARDTFWRAANFTAQAIGISKTSTQQFYTVKPSDTDILFLDWEVRSITAKQVQTWRLQNQITDALAFCINSGWSLLKSNKGWGLSHTINSSNTTAAVRKTDYKRMITDAENEMWMAQLRAGCRTIPTIYAGKTEASYVTSWLRDKQVKDYIFRFTLKMWLSQLPTLENICLWNSSKTKPYARINCKCGLKGSAAHIFSGICKYTRGRATLRHNEVGRIIRQETKRGTTARWSFIGDPDCEPPESLVGKNWKHKIPFEMIIDRDGIMRQGRHTKPDLILADLLSSKRCVVLIIDFTIVVEYMFEASAAEKIRRYQFLVQAILDWLGPGDHRVEVVPITVGRSGIPPPDWGQICSKLKLACTPRHMWNLVQSSIMESNSQMFSSWQIINGLR
jgi:hypothetical protein